MRINQANLYDPGERERETYDKSSSSSHVSTRALGAKAREASVVDERSTDTSGDPAVVVQCRSCGDGIHTRARGTRVYVSLRSSRQEREAAPLATYVHLGNRARGTSPRSARASARLRRTWRQSRPAPSWRDVGSHHCIVQERRASGRGGDARTFGTLTLRRTHRVKRRPAMNLFSGQTPPTRSKSLWLRSGAPTPLWCHWNEGAGAWHGASEHNHTRHGARERASATATATHCARTARRWRTCQRTEGQCHQYEDHAKILAHVGGVRRVWQDSTCHERNAKNQESESESERDDARMERERQRERSPYAASEAELSTPRRKSEKS